MRTYRLRRAIVAMVVLVVASLGGGMGVASANGPEGGGTAGTTVTVTPSDGLADTQNVTVTGSGFLANRPDGFVAQCADIGTGADQCSQDSTFSTDGAGNIVPFTFTVRRTYTSTDSKPVNCAVHACTVNAVTNEKNAHHHLSFGTSVGRLRVQTSPPVPSQILINGVPRDSWGLFVTLAPGSYTVSYTHVEGFTEPAPQTVTVNAGATTNVTGTFTPRGSLRVITSPALPSTISVDGIPRDAWGMWTDLPTGSHQVCYGPVAGYTPPPCQTVNLTAGNLTQITGTFTPSAAGGASGVGLLRVTTNPALPSQIIVDGQIRDSWGLLWMEIAPGSHTVSFTHIEGYTEPASQTVNVVAGQTTTVQGNFTPRGILRVVTSPATPGTISVDGVPRNDWGMWTDLPTGSHQVCFGPAPPKVQPPCQTVNLTAGTLTTVTGNYT